MARHSPRLRKNNVSRASHRLGQDVIRSIRCARVAESRQPHRHGLWVWQSGDVRQRNQNSQNQPGMSLRINETEKWVGKEALRLAFRSSMPGLKPLIVNRLRCGGRTSPRSGCLYHIAGPGLSLHNGAESGENLQRNQAASAAGKSELH